MKNTMEQFNKATSLVEQGMSGMEAAKKVGITPAYYYSTKARQKRLGKTNVVVHDMTKRTPKKTKVSLKTPTGFMVFGSAEFLKSFAESQR